MFSKEFVNKIKNNCLQIFAKHWTQTLIFILLTNICLISLNTICDLFVLLLLLSSFFTTAFIGFLLRKAMAFPDFKPAQPLALRHLNRRYAELDHHYQNNQQNKGPRNNRKFSQKFKAAAKELAMNFGKKSTIHGMSRLFQEHSNKYERFFWFLAIILALLGAIYVCLILSQRFYAGSLQTIVDSTGMPVFHISFPVVTICNANRLNWERLEMAKERFLPKENDTEKLRMFEVVIGLYDKMSFADFEVFKPLENQPVELVNHVNFSLVYEFMTWRCEELLTMCVWRHYPMKCCEIFSMARSKNGLCWSFNTLSTEEGKQKQKLDAKYPWRTGSAGPLSALNVRILMNPEKQFPRINEKGAWVMITEPNVWHRDPYFVPANTETMIEVEPVIYFYDNDTRSLSSAQRHCVFNDERNSYDFKSLAGYIYMIENCQSECHQEYLNRYCNCTVDLLFPPDYFRYAHQPGEEEFVRNNFVGMVCKCFRNCYSLNYISDVRPSFLPADVRDNKSYIDLDVHFRFETMMVYRTSLVFGWIDLMVAFGGIAGLFLGCSLISSMELFYFAFVELPVFVYGEFKNKDKSKLKDNHHQKLHLQHHNHHNQNLNNQDKRRNWGLNNRIMAAKNFQNNEILIDKNMASKNEALQLWTHQYYLTNKHNF